MIQLMLMNLLIIKFLIKLLMNFELNMSNYNVLSHYFLLLVIYFFIIFL